MDNHYEELMHFVGNNVDEVISRNWASDIRRMEKAEHQRDQLREALDDLLDQLAYDDEEGLFEHADVVVRARAALKATED